MDSMIICICSSLISGLLGVVATLYWNDRVGKMSEKKLIFKTLLANLGHIVSEANVQALNLIDVVFYNDAEVRACLQAFVESSTKQPFSAQELEIKYLQLIEKMALALGMKTIDWARIKECVYLPKGLLDKFNEEDLLRKASLQTQMAFAQERLASPRNNV